MTRTAICCLGLAVFLGGVAIGGSPPECSGISGVHPTNGDLDGDLTTVRVASGLSLPVTLAQPPGDYDRLFVVEQQGVIRIIEGGTVHPTPFLDIDNGPVIVTPGGEEGLLGLAFHPDYESNGYFFVYYTDTSGNNVVARYQVSAGDPDVANEASGEIVITFVHPAFPTHNAGRIAFGPDGRLYVAVGDGGSSCDPGSGAGNAQSLESPLGKLHRLNVDALPYTTEGNPFTGGSVPSTWSYGLRNPYSFSIDRETGNIFIADVGQGQWEEVDCGASPLDGGGGENYGWVVYEGTHCPNPSCGPSGSCALADHVAPIHEYDHSVGACAIIGGAVYRGCRMSALHGTYFFADYCLSFLRSFRLPAGRCPTSAITSVLDRTIDLAPGRGLSIGIITSIVEDGQGELYVVDRAGEVFKIVPRLEIMETSGPGAPPFLMGEDWTFEHLASSGHAIAYYTIYRSIDDARGPFECLYAVPVPAGCSGTTCSWDGGDPDDPAPGQTFYYLVTASTADGAESTAGVTSAGTLRVVDSGGVCLQPR